MLTFITGKEGSILSSDHSRHGLHCINLLLNKAIEKLRGYVLKFTIFFNNHEGEVGGGGGLIQTSKIAID